VYGLDTHGELNIWSAATKRKQPQGKLKEPILAVAVGHMTSIIQSNQYAALHKQHFPGIGRQNTAAAQAQIKTARKI
jgi:hypothetical protein